MNTYLQQSKDFIKKSLARSEIINPFRTLFKEVEFETLAYCNRKCEYCPNVDWERFGDDESFFMKDEVFRALIQQLKDLGFSGQISPHLYGEPLSDPRLTKWVAHIRKNLPDSKIKVVTNGDFLSKQKYDELIESGVNVFFISIHSKKLKKICLDMLDQLTEQEKSLLIAKYDPMVLEACRKVYNDVGKGGPQWKELRNKMKVTQINSQRGCILTTNWYKLAAQYNVKLGINPMNALVRAFRGLGNQDVIKYNDLVRICTIVGTSS